MRKSTKVVFMGTPEFAKESLERLVEAGYDVRAVFTNPDKPSGRGMKLKMSPVKEYAIAKDIKVYQPKKIRGNSEVLDILKEIKPDFLTVVAYGKILPKEVLDIPKLGAINVHGSLLPKYRGSAPIQWAIINGEEKTGITTMYMDEGMDTGDMLLKEEINIEKNDNFENVHDKLMVIGADLLVETLDKILSGDIKRIKQDEKETSLAPMITKDMTKIDFSKSPDEIYNFVRGLSPFPGTYIKFDNGKTYKVYKVTPYVDTSIDKTVLNGDILLMSKDALYIKCKDGYVSIDIIQPENSKRMDIKSFMNGNKISMFDKCI